MIKKIFAKAVASSAFYIETKDLLFKKDLMKVEKNVLGLMDEFFVQFSRVPTREELLLQFDKLSEDEKKFMSEYKDFVNSIFNEEHATIDPAVLKEFLREGVVKSEIQSHLVKIADSFEKKESKFIIEDLKDLLFTSLRGEGLEKFTSVNAENAKDNVYFVRHRHSEKVATKVGGLDAMLFGGIGVKEITTVVAPSGRGKTAFLINMMYGFLTQGVDVLYLSMEMTIRDIVRRLYRRILYENKDFLSESNEPEIIKWVNKFFGMTKSRAKILYSPANVCCVDDLKSELLRLEIAEGFVPTVIIVDHLDLMVSKKKSIRQQEGFSYWRLLVDDLREIPVQLSIPVLTATQSTRASTKKVLVGAEDVGESFGKVQSSDVVLSLNQTPEELDNKRMRVAIIKNRDYYKGAEIELYCDLDMMLMCDLYFAQKNGWLG